MAAIGTSPFRGLAKVRVKTAVPGNNRNFTLSLVDVAPNSTGDEIDQDGTGATAWEQAPGSAMTLRLEWDSEGAAPAQQATIARVTIRVPNGAAIGAGTWNPAIAGNSGSATQAIHLDSNPLNGSLDTAQFGMYELRFEVESVGGLGPWGPADSTGAFANPGALTSDFAQGYLRAPATLSTFVHSNAALGGATPATFAYPDTVFTRAVLANTSVENHAIKVSVRESGVEKRATTLAGQTAVTHDATWSGDGSTALTAKVLADLAVANDTSRIEFVAANFGGDNKFVWAATVGASFTRTSELIGDKASNFNVDPSVTVANLTRTSAEAVVNFGLHTATATFNVQNARLENINSTDHASDDDAQVKTRDIVGAATEGTITASVAPNGDGLYSISRIFPGPTLVANRGTGTSGATAAHDTSGRTKSIRVEMLGNGTRPTVNSTSLWVALSDLLRLDVHPQRTNTLSKDADPYATPGSTESTQYVIGSDRLRVFGFCGDVNGVGISGVTVNAAVFDTDGNAPPSSTGSGSTGSGANKGWITSPMVDISPGAPSGNWSVRNTVELTDTGASGNYGDHTAPAVGIALPGSLIQTVGVNPAYTGNRCTAIHIDDEVARQETAIIRFQYIETQPDGTRLNLTLDSAPNIRIYSVDGSGAETESLALTAMTGIGSGTWQASWTPQLNGTFVAEIRFFFAGTAVCGAVRATVRNRHTIKGAIIDRMG